MKEQKFTPKEFFYDDSFEDYQPIQKKWYDIDWSKRPVFRILPT